MDADVLVVGAGPAGLATAGCLIQRGLCPCVIEKAPQLADSWRRHYERLHLHTVKALSALPGLPFPAQAPRYVPRQGVVDYLAAYAAHFGIEPVTGEEALRIERAAGGWQVTTASGRRYPARHLVLATGANRWPNRPAFADEARFEGEILHSAGYRNPAPFVGRRVLVVGMGNTGAEIALDLAEQGVRVALSVRGPVNMVHRDVLGRATQQTSIALSRLPPFIGDTVARLLCDLTVGNLSRHGLQRSRVSPLRQLREAGRTPVIDVGTLARIKAGEIAVHPAIERFVPRGVCFADGREAAFDAVILATGYRAGIERLFPQGPPPLDDTGLPREVVGQGAHAGTYFVGFDIRQPGGLLRAIGQQAERAAEAIASHKTGS
jgi:cation diffusion facilitator CzcD-associated flavoprotein CzcO